MLLSALTISLLHIEQIRSEFIECFESNCREQDIECFGSDGQCTFDCIDDLSCFNSRIICADEATCHITCNSQYACLFSTLQCPNNADCFINGANINSMSSTYINCPTSNTSTCNVKCDETLSCQHVLIDGKLSGDVQMECNEFNACWDMKLYCPPFSQSDQAKHCIITGENGASHPQIYALNGWNDIDLTSYVGDIGAKSQLFCNANYTDSCAISSEFNCVDNTSLCYSWNGTLSPTLEPSLEPTLEPTNAPVTVEKFTRDIILLNVSLDLNVTDVPAPSSVIDGSIDVTLFPTIEIIPNENITVPEIINEHSLNEQVAVVEGKEDHKKNVNVWLALSIIIAMIGCVVLLVWMARYKLFKKEEDKVYTYRVSSNSKKTIEIDDDEELGYMDESDALNPCKRISL